MNAVQPVWVVVREVENCESGIKRKCKRLVNGRVWKIEYQLNIILAVVIWTEGFD